ncbi:MAG: thioredoxin family protein [Burkholderiales bacterium]|nr:thioredoxin family protein [Burkholderiales bacterium]
MRLSIRACIAALSLAATSYASAASAALSNYGRAPEFVGIEKWLNSAPLSLAALRGKPVLIDFWTYDCINCVHTLPYVKQWYDKYHDKGLAVVGVHTPEYAFEYSTANVQAALKRFDIRYPVAQDNAYATWTAYRNQFWPALYLIDANGRIVYQTVGEGHYEETEAVIQKLLAQPAS